MSGKKRQYWLLKSEPDAFSIDDLRNRGRETWDGVRNYQARNFLCEMKVGDLALFYHSRTKPPAVVGIAEISRTAEPDDTAADPDSSYFDPKHTAEKPRWFAPEVRYVQHFSKSLPLNQLKSDPKLATMKLVQKGQRLSVQPVTATQFRHICQLGGIKAPG